VLGDLRIADVTHCDVQNENTVSSSSATGDTPTPDTFFMKT
jgi:hypothetical protein